MINFNEKVSGNKEGLQALYERVARHPHLKGLFADLIGQTDPEHPEPYLQASLDDISRGEESYLESTLRSILKADKLPTKELAECREILAQIEELKKA